MRTTLIAMGSVLAATALGQGVPHYVMTKSVTLGGDGGWDYLTVDPGAHRLYLSRGTHLMVVDTNTLSVIGDIPNTPGVHGAAIVGRHGVGFTSNGRGNSVTEFDLHTFQPIRTIPVGQNPDAILY